jgi:hypothetical protein
MQCWRSESLLPTLVILQESVWRSSSDPDLDTHQQGGTDPDPHYSPDINVASLKSLKGDVNGFDTLIIRALCVFQQRNRQLCTSDYVLFSAIQKSEEFEAGIKNFSVADPGSCTFLTPGSRTEKSCIRDKHPDHISESLSTIFWAKITYSLLRTWCLSDPGFVTGMEKFGFRDVYPGSETLES